MWRLRMIGELLYGVGYFFLVILALIIMTTRYLLGFESEK